MFPLKKAGIKPWLLLGSTGLLTSAAYRQLMRYFKVANPDFSILQGKSMTRQAQRVIAVTAHHDDLEFLAGGTLRLLSLAGSQIAVIVATAGERQRNNLSNAEEIRNQEQRNAGIILGYNRVHFLHLSDLGLAQNPLFQSRLKQEWDKFQPDLALAMDPSFPIPFLIHPDHLAAGRAVLNIVRSSEDERQTRVLFYGSKQPNVVMDISEVIEDKIQSVISHRSQLKTYRWLYRMFIFTLGRLTGKQTGIPYGENFRSLYLPPVEEQSYLENWSSQVPEPKL